MPLRDVGARFHCCRRRCCVAQIGVVQLHLGASEQDFGNYYMLHAAVGGRHVRAVREVCCINLCLAGRSGATGH
jgi:hypothetical protein